MLWWLPTGLASLLFLSVFLGPAVSYNNAPATKIMAELKDLLKFSKVNTMHFQKQLGAFGRDLDMVSLEGAMIFMGTDYSLRDKAHLLNENNVVAESPHEHLVNYAMGYELAEFLHSLLFRYDGWRSELERHVYAARLYGRDWFPLKEWHGQVGLDWITNYRAIFVADNPKLLRHVFLRPEKVFQKGEQLEDWKRNREKIIKFIKKHVHRLILHYDSARILGALQTDADLAKLFDLDLAKISVDTLYELLDLNSKSLFKTEGRWKLLLSIQGKHATGGNLNFDQVEYHLGSGHSKIWLDNMIKPVANYDLDWILQMAHKKGLVDQDFTKQLIDKSDHQPYKVLTWIHDRMPEQRPLIKEKLAAVMRSTPTGKEDELIRLISRYNTNHKPSRCGDGACGQALLEFIKSLDQPLNPEPLDGSLWHSEVLELEIFKANRGQTLQDGYIAEIENPEFLDLALERRPKEWGIIKGCSKLKALQYNVKIAGESYIQSIRDIESAFSEDDIEVVEWLVGLDGLSGALETNIKFVEGYESKSVRLIKWLWEKRQFAPSKNDLMRLVQVGDLEDCKWAEKRFPTSLGSLTAEKIPICKRKVIEWWIENVDKDYDPSTSGSFEACINEWDAESAKWIVEQWSPKFDSSTVSSMYARLLPPKGSSLVLINFLDLIYEVSGMLPEYPRSASSFHSREEKLCFIRWFENVQRRYHLRSILQQHGHGLAPVDDLEFILNLPDLWGNDVGSFERLTMRDDVEALKLLHEHEYTKGHEENIIKFSFAYKRIRVLKWALLKLRGDAPFTNKFIDELGSLLESSEVDIERFQKRLVAFGKDLDMVSLEAALTLMGEGYRGRDKVRLFSENKVVAGNSHEHLINYAMAYGLTEVLHAFLFKCDGWKSEFERHVYAARLYGRGWCRWEEWRDQVGLDWITNYQAIFKADNPKLLRDMLDHPEEVVFQEGEQLEDWMRKRAKIIRFIKRHHARLIVRYDSARILKAFQTDADLAKPFDLDPTEISDDAFSKLLDLNSQSLVKAGSRWKLPLFPQGKFVMRPTMNFDQVEYYLESVDSKVWLDHIMEFVAKYDLDWMLQMAYEKGLANQNIAKQLISKSNFSYKVLTWIHERMPEHHPLIKEKLAAVMRSTPAGKEDELIRLISRYNTNHKPSRCGDGACGEALLEFINSLDQPLNFDLLMPLRWSSQILGLKVGRAIPKWIPSDNEIRGMENAEFINLALERRPFKKGRIGDCPKLEVMKYNADIDGSYVPDDVEIGVVVNDDDIGLVKWLKGHRRLVQIYNQHRLCFIELKNKSPQLIKWLWVSGEFEPSNEDLVKLVRSGDLEGCKLARERSPERLRDLATEKIPICKREVIQWWIGTVNKDYDPSASGSFEECIRQGDFENAKWIAENYSLKFDDETVSLVCSDLPQQEGSSLVLIKFLDLIYKKSGLIPTSPLPPEKFYSIGEELSYLYWFEEASQRYNVRSAIQQYDHGPVHVSDLEFILNLPDLWGKDLDLGSFEKLVKREDVEALELLHQHQYTKDHEEGIVNFSLARKYIGVLKWALPLLRGNA